MPPLLAIPAAEAVMWGGAALIAGWQYYRPGGTRDQLLKALSPNTQPTTMQMSPSEQSDAAKQEAGKEAGAAADNCPECTEEEKKKGKKPTTPEELADSGSPHPDNPTTGNGIRQVTKPGGYTQAEQDFDSLGAENQKTYPNGTRVGTLSDGRVANVRPSSTSGEPTVEIQGNGTRQPIKIRYTP